MATSFPATSEPLPPWRPLLRGALKRQGRSPQARWLQLASLGADGTPRVRTLVFRGWAGAAALDLLTDRRSAKSGELTGEAPLELCWLLPRARSQFRLQGSSAAPRRRRGGAQPMAALGGPDARGPRPLGLALPRGTPEAGISLSARRGGRRSPAGSFRTAASAAAAGGTAGAGGSPAPTPLLARAHRMAGGMAQSMRPALWQATINRSLH